LSFTVATHTIPAVANTFGQLFRITTWGESHGGVGVVIDGCPPRLELAEADIQPDLDRRRPGRSGLFHPQRDRYGSDSFRHLRGPNLGTPISMWVKNEDVRSEAYWKWRPSSGPRMRTTLPGEVRHSRLAEAVARVPGKRLAALLRARWQKRFCANATMSKSSLM
jgi:hypothetical protein